jgi:hypothetical protein
MLSQKYLILTQYFHQIVELPQTTTPGLNIYDSLIMADEPKPEISQVEATPIQHHHHGSDTLEKLAELEDEPQTPYQLGWRTILAVITLSMGNVCAALSNTVCCSSQCNNSVIRTDTLRQTQQSNSKSRLSPGHQQMLPWHRGLPTGISSLFLPWVLFL